MPGLAPGIHVLLGAAGSQDVDGRDKPGHDHAEPAADLWLFVICDSLGLVMIRIRDRPVPPAITGASGVLQGAL